MHVDGDNDNGFSADDENGKKHNCDFNDGGDDADNNDVNIDITAVDGQLILTMFFSCGKDCVDNLFKLK